MLLQFFYKFAFAPGKQRSEATNDPKISEDILRKVFSAVLQFTIKSMNVDYLEKYEKIKSIDLRFWRKTWLMANEERSSLSPRMTFILVPNHAGTGVGHESIDVK